MSLPERRRAIAHLLDPQQAADARAYYYAFDHADNRTSIITYRPATARAQGYLCFSRTGFDLFRPLLTLRLPDDPLAARELIGSGIQPNTSLLISAPADSLPLLQALFTIELQTEMMTLVLDRGRYQPIINVLVTTESGPNSLPRYIIRRDGETFASAGVNWQTARYAEISVNTSSGNRRQGYGRSVAAALCGHLLDIGRRPLYAVASDNAPSIQLAESIGFADIGIRTVFLDATFHG